MRFALLSLVLSATAASADPKPDLILIWQEGEVSKDTSIDKTEFRITGTNVHFELKHLGRDNLHKNHGGDGTIKDAKKLAAAIAALDKAAVVKRKDDASPYSGQQIEACLFRGDTQRCILSRPGDPSTAEVEAMTAVHAAVLDGIPLDKLIGP